MFGPAQLLLILSLFRVSEDSWRTERDEISYLIDLFSESLLCQFLLLQFVPGYFELHNVEEDDFLYPAVVVHRLREGVIIKILKELHSLVVQLVPITLELPQIFHEFGTKLALFIPDLQLLNCPLEIRITLSFQTAVQGPRPKQAVFL